jgi:hypothetical protein
MSLHSADEMALLDFFVLGIGPRCCEEKSAADCGQAVRAVGGREDDADAEGV